MAEKSSTRDLELKEYVDRTHFQKALQAWQNALERNQSFDVMVKGESCTIPAEAFEHGRFQLEYEIDEGEYELQFTLKWQ